MSRKYKFHDNDKLYFISFAVISWVDLFIRNEYKEIIIRSFLHCVQHKSMELYAYCIMTSHVHMIIGSRGNLMQNIIRVLKRHTSESLHKEIIQHLTESRKEWILAMMTEAGTKNSNNVSFQLWQQHSQPVELNSPKILHQKLNYIHHNPVAAGFVDKEEDWLYSSARNYYGWQGLIDVI
ncbi:MAG: transposase [Chitinophagaceae bacterium]|nr:transposase [Chitinophagaceae bacterium]